MKKSDFTKLRTMLNNEAEVQFFNYHPHVVIIVRGKYALAYPEAIFFDWIADGLTIPQNIPAGTGVYMRRSGRGRSLRRAYKTISADIFRAELLAAVKSVTGAALPKNRIFAAAEKYNIDPVMIQRLMEIKGWSPEKAAFELWRGAKKIMENAEKLGFAVA